MALRLREISLGLDEAEECLAAKVAQELGIPVAEVSHLRIVRMGIDARRKGRILRVYNVEFEVPDEARVLQGLTHLSRLEAANPVALPEIRTLPIRQKVLVVGMGPAGLFCALHLARCGQEVVLVDRGQPLERRVADVNRFWKDGQLKKESNVQFGEGGAGTFSDGKLTTRVNHPWTRFVLQTLIDFGAPAEILFQAKPHVGTDRLRLVLINFRRELQRLGVTIRFATRLDGLSTSAGRLRGALLTSDSGSEELAANHVVLAPGHSARDTYAMLHASGVRLEAKPFAVGVRIEHPAALINTIQYGINGHPRLPTADYALTWNDRQSGRGVYSFCMCPGGEVVNSASEEGGVVVNGMSRLGRNGELSNSALVVSVRPQDCGSPDDPLAGIAFQRKWERLAFAAGGRDYRVPAQNVISFLQLGQGPLRSSCRPGITAVELDQVLPAFVSTGLRQALPQFDRRMRGFVTAEATLTGVETRTSAPLRIVRGEDGQSVSLGGLYPAGEGAGYAGGIMSAALDGLKVAQHIAENLSVKEH